MNLKPKQVIPREKHIEHDQFIRIEKGFGRAIITNEQHKVIQDVILEDGSAIIIPAGKYHEIQNTHDILDLKLYTIYAPPEHEDKLIEDFIDDKLVKIGGFTNIYKNKFNKYNNKLELLFCNMDKII